MERTCRSETWNGPRWCKAWGSVSGRGKQDRRGGSVSFPRLLDSFLFLAVPLRFMSKRLCFQILLISLRGKSKACWSRRLLLGFKELSYLARCFYIDLREA